MTYTFAQAMQAFNKKVSIKYPPVSVATRRVQEMGKGRDRGRYGGIESRRYGGRSRVSGRLGRSRGRGYSPKLG